MARAERWAASPCFYSCPGLSYKSPHYWKIARGTMVPFSLMDPAAHPRTVAFKTRLDEKFCSFEKNRSLGKNPSCPSITIRYHHRACLYTWFGLNIQLPVLYGRNCVLHCQPHGNTRPIPVVSSPCPASVLHYTYDSLCSLPPVIRHVYHGHRAGRIPPAAAPGF